MLATGGATRCAGPESGPANPSARDRRHRIPPPAPGARGACAWRGSPRRALARPAVGPCSWRSPPPASSRTSRRRARIPRPGRVRVVDDEPLPCLEARLQQDPLPPPRPQHVEVDPHVGAEEPLDVEGALAARLDPAEDDCLHAPKLPPACAGMQRLRMLIPVMTTNARFAPGSTSAAPLLRAVVCLATALDSLRSVAAPRLAPEGRENPPTPLELYASLPASKGSCELSFIAGPSRPSVLLGRQ
jgi:hypothetical protein